MTNMQPLLDLMHELQYEPPTDEDADGMSDY